ncbi:MAG: CheY-like chemotaxis protein [Myxococcota bacterium]|jgi:CheY-like chemotaxis protein
MSFADVAEAGGRVRRVLIADSNRNRAERLAQSCNQQGLKAEAVLHGAAALEVALATPPDLVVCEMDLPLVCGVKLAEILRANPRTHGVRFLMLGPDGASANRVEVGDVVVSVSAQHEEVLRVIGLQLTKCERIEALQNATNAGDTVSGDLAKLPLADLLQVAHLARKSGRMALDREGDGENIALLGEATHGEREHGFVLLRDGEVLQAESGSATGEKALFRMLAWREGEFVFETGRRPEAAMKIIAPVRALLAEGMRQLAEWDRLALQLPTRSSTVKQSMTTSELPNIVHPLTQEVLLLLEHYDQVGAIVDHCTYPDYQVLRTLQTLCQRNVVSLGQAQVCGLGPETSGAALFSEAQVSRLREHLLGATPRGERVVAGKILVVAGEAGTLSNLLNLLRSVPTFEVSPGIGRGVEPKTELSSIGKLRLAGELELELIQVPSAETYRPLWPLAARGALATLILHSGNVSQLQEGTNEVRRVLHKGTRTDALHVVMLARKERVDPGDLRESLALLENASLILLPLEGDKEPTALLRSLFARVVP